MKPNLRNSTIALVAGHSADALVTASALAIERGNVIEGNRLIRVLAVSAARFGKESWQNGDWIAAGLAVASVKILAVLLVAGLIVAGSCHLERVPHAAKFVGLLAAVGFLAAASNLVVMFA